MGALLGLTAGLGLFLLVAGASAPPVRRRPDRLTALLQAADLADVGASRVRLLTLGGAALAGLLVIAVSGVLALGLVAAVALWSSPRSLLRRRAEQRATTVRAAWPDAIDDVSSAVRAGLSLPEALAALGAGGPPVLRPAFTQLAEEHRAGAGFDECLDRLADRLADPIADQVVEAVRLVREVGGSDVGTVLASLATFAREEGRTRAELEVRQGWTVTAARLGLAAPWVVLALLAAGSHQTVAAYNAPGGLLVLCVGGATSVAAYRLMHAIGRLPTPARVLR